MVKKDEFLKIIRGLSKEDLAQKISDNKVRLQKLAFSHKVNSLSNPKILGQLKKDIARLQTELHTKK